MPIHVATVWRYPVKGLSPEPLERVTVIPGECVPQDRRFAIARSSTRFDSQHPEWLPKKNFIMLMRDAKLALLRTHFDEESGVLAIEREGHLPLRERITEPEGRARMEEFFAEFLKGSLRGPPRIVEAPGHAFSDARRKPNTATYKYVSLVNLASVGALQAAVPLRVDPMRFRANIYHDGSSAWEELDWVGSEITVGDARLRVVSPIVRCAAIDVNPDTAERDVNIPKILRKEFGHVHMGVYAEVIGGGEIVKGDLLVPPG